MHRSSIERTMDIIGRCENVAYQVSTCDGIWCFFTTAFLTFVIVTKEVFQSAAATSASG